MTDRSTNHDRPFVPGETVEFAGERYEVLANHGESGRVRDGDTVIEPFRWVFEGEAVVRVGASA